MSEIPVDPVTDPEIPDWAIHGTLYSLIVMIMSVIGILQFEEVFPVALYFVIILAISTVVFVPCYLQLMRNKPK